MPDAQGLTEYQRRRQQFDANICREALAEHKGNQSAAARSLGLSRNTFRKYLGLTDLDPGGDSRQEKSAEENQ